MTERDFFLRLGYSAGFEGAETVVYHKPQGRREPTWLEDVSPDGRYLLASDYIATTQADLWLIDMESGERHPYVEKPGSDWRGRFSPNGKWIAYTRVDRGLTQVFVEAFPGPGGRWQITPEGGFSPVWSRNGTELFFIKGGELWSCPVQTEPNFVTGRPQRLFTWPGAPFRTALTVDYVYDTVPDGGFIALLSSDQDRGEVRLNVALNWTAELERLVPTK